MTRTRLLAVLGLVAGTTALATENETPTAADAIAAIEQRRIEVVEQITPATIAVFNDNADNGGSGVIISADGYALTNFHVVAPCGPFMLCGMPDGSLVETVLIGLDPTGDIALIRLLGDREFPAAAIGDSDAATIGDEVFVAGNPFLLADDFQPTITHGILSGTRRYQYPSGTVLEYADCLQTDAAINPGNSGGPLYDGEGRLIGINGRASFEKRGRVNVGVGYAVSINQAMRFVDQLQTGRIVDHGSLGATVRTTADGRVLVDAVDESSDAFRRGLSYGDEVLAIDGHRVTSANALMNAVATRPAAWRSRFKLRNAAGVHEVSIRLTPRHRGGELERVVESELAPLKATKPVSLYEHRPGYANFAVNRRATRRLLDKCPQRAAGDWAGEWRVQAEDAAGESVVLHLTDDRAEAVTPNGRFWIETSRPLNQQDGPPGTGGLLVALHAWRSLLVVRDEEMKGFVAHGETPWGDRGVMADRLVGAFDAARAEYYFDVNNGNLIGMEAWLSDDADPCRLTFDSFGSGPTAFGGDAPGTITISRGDEALSEWSLTGFESQPPNASEGP